ncbi:MAG: helix-turn-helix transcriptional regulator [Deltaproteobacteria bacterium]|nr:helix-turn-helix transcriptional regulator [Deltaproteobacteria bacterium]
MTELQRKIKAALVFRGMTFGDLASQVGVSRTHLQRCVRGDRRLPVTRIETVARVLGVAVTWLVGAGR